MARQVAEKLEVRNRYRRTLLRIREQICDLLTYPTEHEDCKKAHIHQYTLALDKKDDDRPRFFTPYRGGHSSYVDEKLPESFAKFNPGRENHLNVQGLHLFMESYLGSMRTHEPRGIYFREATSTSANSLKSIITGRCLIGPYEALPHMKCMMEGGEAVGDDRLLRGEILAIIQVMAGRLNTKSVRPHVLALVGLWIFKNFHTNITEVKTQSGANQCPISQVMFYSAMGPQHIRVLEAYFNGENLVIRKTKLYDMTKYDAATLSLLTRWWMGHAGGETKTISRELLEE
ncbi:uncharacterized protein KD926_006850 [Aspergillus affinis]|uniref:uncharacterized protein n=1 Tax=Aspergillus affinis TaxID=1070780 RepID=UPI0022FDCD34|nr:uncharacterized protein KD926_006850 [Aspergillus affinis]KAI9041454.1 hypothetical protein KD926_006850 [Aspergillus affinis]